MAIEPLQLPVAAVQATPMAMSPEAETWTFSGVVIVTGATESSPPVLPAGGSSVVVGVASTGGAVAGALPGPGSPAPGSVVPGSVVPGSVVPGSTGGRATAGSQSVSSQ